MRQFSQLFIVMLRESYRQPAVLFWGFAFPILMAWGLGAAFSSDKTTVSPIAFVGTESQFEKAVQQTGNTTATSSNTSNSPFEIEYTDPEKADLLYKRGEVLLILKFVEGNWQYHYDPNNSESGVSYYRLSNWLDKGIDYRKPLPGLYPINKKGSRYIDFLIPGMMGMGIMFSCMWGTCYSLIEKRSKKLLRRMYATPMNPNLFFLAQMGNRLCISILEAGVLLLFATLYFGVEIQGNILLLFLILVAGIFGFVGLALLASSRTSNTQIGNGLLNLVTMPMMICSGVFFSYHNFPEWAQSVIRYLPLTLINDSLRAVMNEGAGIFQVLPALVILFAMGVFFLPLSAKIYKWY